MFHKRQMTTGAWLMFLLLMGIPFVNFVVIILILLDKSYNPSLRSFIKAQLVIVIIGLAILLGFWGLIIQFLSQALEESGESTVFIMNLL